MIVLVSALWSPVAVAGPNDVTLSGLAEHAGLPVTEDTSDDYLAVVRGLGTLVANPAANPAATLGSAGSSISFSGAFGFTDLGADRSVPTPFARATVDELTGPFWLQPGLTARKGFPFSFEAGLTATWFGGSRQGSFGGFARLGLIEGSQPWPDLSVHAGYAGFVGNDELELGTSDYGVTLGTQLPFGVIEGINNATWSPWFDYSLLQIRAFPVLPDDVAAQVGAVQVGGKSDTAALIAHRLTAGFQINNGTVTLRLFGHWSPKATAGFTLAMGFEY